MMPEFEIFGLTLPSYWVMCAMGMLLIIALSMWRAPLYKLPYWKALVLALCIDGFGVAGVFLLGFIQSGFRSWSTSFMGALLFTPIFIALIGLALKVKPLHAAAFSAASICLMGACMKVGCYLAGCCGGIVLNGELVPVQIIEAGLCFAITIALLIIERIQKLTDMAFPIYMVLYAVMRFPIEYLRDTDKNVLGMSVGQITALVVFIIGAAILTAWILLNKKASKKALPEERG